MEHSPFFDSVTDCKKSQCHRLRQRGGLYPSGLHLGLRPGRFPADWTLATIGLRSWDSGLKLKNGLQESSSATDLQRGGLYPGGLHLGLRLSNFGAGRFQADGALRQACHKDKRCMQESFSATDLQICGLYPGGLHLGLRPGQPR